jgi:hypothetical protein
MSGFAIVENSTDTTNYRCSEGALSSTSALPSVSEACVTRSWHEILDVVAGIVQWTVDSPDQERQFN